MASTRSGHVLPNLGEDAVREQPVQLGADGHLVGVLARPGAAEVPGAGAGPAARPVVIFLNAGVLHRVGPHRLHVILARRLAAAGIASLRLDLSGIGDSRAVPGALSFRESAVADTRAAIDWLAGELGAGAAPRVVLFGLCSGADNALATAAADPRVAAIAIVDPPAYATPRARMRRVAARVQRLGSVRAVARWGADALLRRVRARLRPAAAPRGDDDVEYTGGREVPPAELYRAQLGALIRRGVAVLSIYSGALGERYNHADQLFELFPELRGKVDRAYFPAANHMFTELDVQADLVAAVTAWIERR
jgi:dienelactone hydrolase